MSSSWVFFDFEKHWDIFYKAWQSDKVQDFLKNDLDNWCWTETYNVNTKPMWLQNEPEWYSELINSKSYLPPICNKVNDLIHKEQLVFHYRKTMAHKNPKKYIKMEVKDIRREFYESSFDRLYNEVSNEPYTLDTLVDFVGYNNISEALYECAKQIFNEDNDISIHNKIVYIPSMKITFDLIRFYEDRIYKPV